MIYFIGTAVMFFFGFLFDNMPIQSTRDFIKTRMIWFLYAAPLLGIAMFRYDVGTDYRSVYWNYYEAVSIGKRSVYYSNIQLEVGFYYFNRVLSFLSKSPIVLFVVSSLIIYLAVFFHIRKTNKRIALSTLLFVLSGLYFTSFNVVRQFLALSIVLIFWRAIQERKVLVYLIGCLLAGSFHLSAIGLFVLYLLKGIKIDRKRFLSILLLSIVVMPVFGKVVDFLVMNTRYKYYISSRLYITDGDYTGVIFATILTLVLMIMYNRLESDTKVQLWIWTLLIYDMVVVGSFFIPLCNRIAIYFKFFVFVNLLPCILGKIQKRNRVILCTGLIIFLFASVVYLYYYRGVSNVFPYRSVFETL